MCSEFKSLLCFILLLLCSCTPYKNMQRVSRGELAIGLSVQEKEIEEEQDVESVVDSIWDTVSDGPIIMNAIKDTETGEMVATDIIKASKVVARFRNVAERDGYVSIGFNVHVPGQLSLSRWQLKILPQMRIQADTVSLDPVYVTGKGYREMQMRGYQRYQAFLASIITDTTDLVRINQLEIFLQRYFPLTYAMKTDSTFIPEPMAANLFGVTQKEALMHYTRHWRVKRNEWKKNNKERMFRKYVKDPIVKEGLRLDTVLVSGSDFIYKYTHTFKSRPGLKKVMLTLDGRLYERGECIASLPFPEELTFYISSLSTLADEMTRYKMLVLERNAYDNTKALIDFRLGSSEVDTTLGDNASEFRRIRRCIEDVVARDEYVLDSLKIMASCSPEGSYRLNSRLADARSKAVGKYIEDIVPQDWVDRIKTVALPENWEQLRILVVNDTVLEPSVIRRIMTMTENLVEPDKTDVAISGQQFCHLGLDLVFKTLGIVLLVIIGKIPVIHPISITGGSGFPGPGFSSFPATAVWFVPIQILRVVKSQFHAMFVTCFGKFSDHITAKRCGIYNVIAIYFGMVHAEAFMMLGSYDHVFHSGILCQFYPFFGVEINRIKYFGQLFIFSFRNTIVLLNPLAYSGHALTFPFTGKNTV